MREIHLVNSVKFPVRLECGAVSFVQLKTDEKTDLEFARMERGDNEVVIRLRLKCRHQSHAEVPDA